MSFFSLIYVNFHKPLSVNDTIEGLATSEDSAFLETYKRHILPKVAEFDKIRLKALTAHKKRSRIALALILLIVAWLGYAVWTVSTASHYTLRELGGFAGSACILLYLWASKPERDYKKKVKEQIFPETLLFHGMHTFKLGPPHQIREVFDSGIIPEYDFFHAEDYVEGSYKKTHISLFEFFYGRGEIGMAQAFAETDKGFCKEARLVIRIKLEKPFSGKTLLIKKQFGFKKPLAGRASPQRKYSLKQNKSLREEVFVTDGKELVSSSFAEQSYEVTEPLPLTLEKVDVENSLIKSKYLVLSTDQVEARYLLSLSFMERLNKLQEAFHSEFIECSFYNNELLLLIKTKKDRFEAKSIFEPTTFIDECENLKLEMQQIFSIIDELKLHEQTRL